MSRTSTPVVAELTALVDRLGSLPAPADDAERIDRIALLEQIKGSVAAAQARESVDLYGSQVASQQAQGVPASKLGRGVADQVALARGMTPAAGSKLMTFAHAMVHDLPHTFQLLREGRISEWAASVVAKETAALSVPDRRAVDADVAAGLVGISPRQAGAAARRLAYERDPGSALRRGRTARSDRRVGIRPAPDTMAILSAFVPAEQGVAAWASLDSHARSLKNTGDARTIGQLMADTLVERITGQASAEAVPVEIGITMTADALLDEDDVPGFLNHYGPLPAPIARQVAAGGHPGEPSDRADHDGVDHDRARVFLRRIFTDPIDDTVVAVDTRRRRFDGALARLIRYRDQTCRDPFCDAPIRHLDHRTPHGRGGPTSADNGEGRCERGNYVKQMPGWRIESESPRTSITTTPTGHSYRSTIPPALGPGSDHRRIGHRRALRRVGFLQREQIIAALPTTRPSTLAPHRRQ